MSLRRLGRAHFLVHPIPFFPAVPPAVPLASLDDLARILYIQRIKRLLGIYQGWQGQIRNPLSDRTSVRHWAGRGQFLLSGPALYSGLGGISSHGTPGKLDGGCVPSCAGVDGKEVRCGCICYGSC